ncbi:hypothetical protein ACXM0N_20105 [Peribacillus simplex]
MLKSIYWVKDDSQNVITAAAGFRDQEGIFEYGIEKWEKRENGWEYIGRRIGISEFIKQSLERQNQLENDKRIKLLLLK